MYSIFVKTLQTDQGKVFVREHEDDYNAQEVFHKLKDHSLKSTKATIDSSKILSYITSAKIGDGTWKGSSESFILHWEEQVQLYETLVKKTEYFS